MCKRILKVLGEMCGNFITARSLVAVIKYAPYIRKGQHQMIADFCLLELVENGRI